eukprot:TRINITY_DN83133_c0_g1_i1.p1 TRINITY_DN83133_c0_g1~~TRINITY_DN83133_c0_g1_i1.p1  ORF type:complete len:535 (+),score=122.97 TRINITY_DN83133_c0_g1_i1:63-1607(+)
MRVPSLLLSSAAAVAVGVDVDPSLQEASCDVASVGGGWSGIYFAYRHFRDGHVPGSKICIFEASERIGGRTYSVPVDVVGHGRAKPDKWVIDVGAYRFTPDMHLPGDLILHDLKLPTACYEPDCAPANKDFPPGFMFNYSAPLRRIIDPANKNLPAGYATALKAMVERMREGGVRVMMNSELVDIKKGEDDFAILEFADSKTVVAKKVLLNLPRTPLQRLRSVKELAGDRTVRMMNCTKFDPPPFGGFSNITMGKALTKAYAYYDDAWWYSVLNKTEGQFPAGNAFVPRNTSEQIPIGIHFNDGPVLCDDKPADGLPSGCRGWLQVLYSISPESFFSGLVKDHKHPMAFLKKDMPGAEDRLKELHAALMEALDSMFHKAGLTGKKPTVPPEALMVGSWSRAGDGFTAPTKVYYSVDSGDSPAKACGVPGLTEDEYRASILTPFPSLPHVHVANNDWIIQEVKQMFGDWAEESLLQAERALYIEGVPKPDYLNSTYYKKFVVDRAPTAASTTIVV